jgi:hypothetical protein
VWFGLGGFWAGVVVVVVVVEVEADAVNVPDSVPDAICG